MSIISILRDYLKEYDGIEMVQTDMAGEAGFSLSPSGNTIAKTDILGNTTYQNNYVFFAREHAGDEVDRQDNYDFLESFCSWVEKRNGDLDLPVLPSPYRAKSLAVSNVLLMDIEDDGTGTYQVQIQFKYEKGE